MISIRLGKLLTEKGKTRYWLAKQTGVSTGNLKKLIEGETTAIEFSVLERICKELDCQPGELLTFVNNEDEKVN